MVILTLTIVWMATRGAFQTFFYADAGTGFARTITLTEVRGPCRLACFYWSNEWLDRKFALSVAVDRKQQFTMLCIISNTHPICRSHRWICRTWRIQRPIFMHWVISFIVFNLGEVYRNIHVVQVTDRVETFYRRPRIRSAPIATKKQPDIYSMHGFLVKALALLIISEIIDKLSPHLSVIAGDVSSSVEFDEVIPNSMEKTVPIPRNVNNFQPYSLYFSDGSFPG